MPQPKGGHAGRRPRPKPFGQMSLKEKLRDLKRVIERRPRSAEA